MWLQIFLWRTDAYIFCVFFLLLLTNGIHIDNTNERHAVLFYTRKSIDPMNNDYMCTFMKKKLVEMFSLWLVRSNKKNTNQNCYWRRKSYKILQNGKNSAGKYSVLHAFDSVVNLTLLHSHQSNWICVKITVVQYNEQSYNCVNFHRLFGIWWW